MWMQMVRGREGENGSQGSPGLWEVPFAKSRTRLPLELGDAIRIARVGGS